jgi:hypothetical protein
MFKKLFIAASLLIGWQGLYAQRQQIVIQNGNIYVSRVGKKANHSLPSGGTPVYWQDQWNRGKIKMKNGAEIEQFLLRYDLTQQGLEVQLPQEVQLLPGHLVAEFELWGVDHQWHRFVDLHSVYPEQALDSGFYEILVAGGWTLLRQTQVHFRRSQFEDPMAKAVPQEKFTRQEKWYLLHQEQLIPIPARRKQALKVLSPYRPDVGDWAETVSFRPKEEASMRQLVAWLNG